jgi:hypothetical protein
MNRNDVIPDPGVTEEIHQKLQSESSQFWPKFQPNISENTSQNFLRLSQILPRDTD